MQGPIVASRIREKIREVEAEHDRSNVQAVAAEERIPRLDSERQQVFLRLAEIYLPELGQETADRLREQLPGLHETILAILAERRGDLEDTESQIVENRRLRSQLEDELEKTTDEVEAKAEERERLQAQADDALEKDPDYPRLVQETRQANERLKQAIRRLEAAEQEKTEKLPAYESNVCFSYLRERRFGTPEAQGNGLTKRLDGWVARKIGYREQEKNYRLLSEVPQVLQKEAVKGEEELQRQRQEVLDLEARVEDRLGLTQVIEAGEALYQKRTALVERLERTDESFHKLISDRESFESAKGPHYDKAIEEASAFLEEQGAEDLKSLARSTETRSDDGLAAKVEDLDRKILLARRELQDAIRARNLMAQKLKDLVKLDSSFHRQDYDASNSTFGQGFNIDELLTALVGGAFTLGKVIETISRFQKFRTRDYAKGAATVADVLMTLAEVGGAMADSGAFGGRRSRRMRGGRGFPTFGGMGGGGRRSRGGFGGRKSRTTGGFG